MKKKSILMLFPLAAALALGSCGGSNSGKTPGDSIAQADSTKTDSTAEQTDHMVPSPLQVALIFKKSQMKYLTGLTNPVDKASNFTTKIARAQGMGIYSADMAYCVINKQTQDAQKDLKTIKDLATQVDLGKIFDNSSLYSRFTNNVDKEDSLRDIIADIQMESDMLMSTNQQAHLYGVIYSAAWIESMYIGSKVYEQDKNLKIAPILLEQLGILGSIVGELKNHEKADPAIPGILAQMTELQTLYNSIPAIQKLKDSDEVDFSKVSLTKEELESLTNKIVEIRTKIING